MALVVEVLFRRTKLQGGILMKSETVKQALYDAIQAITDYKWLYSARPGKDNTRNRKFPFSKMLSSILAFRGGTLNREIMDFFGLDPNIGTSSAFIQQRAKILPEAFECLFQHFNLAYIQEKGWYFLIRIKDNTNGITSGLILPDKNEYDVPFRIRLTRKQTNSVKQLLKDKNHYKFVPTSTRFDYLPQSSRKQDPAVFYDLSFRIVRFPISDTICETIITNLDAEQFPLSEIKRLYAMRWGIETSFRDLKHTLGLLHLHAKKVEFVLQEIFAKLTMYNFCELITQSVVIQQGQKKYAYKVTFSDAVHVCFEFFLRNVPPPIVEAMLMNYISPIRPGRKDTRKQTQKPAVSFTYRVA